MNKISESKEFVQRPKYSQQNKTQCCQGNFEQIATEIDIVIYIYKLLGFVDQMRLARVNVLLQDVFKTYIWKESYSTMKIVENYNGHFLVLNGRAANWLYLKPMDFEEFLKIYANDVQELITSNESLRRIRMPSLRSTLQDIQDETTDEEEIEDPVDNLEQHRQSPLGIWRIMKNLKHLSCEGKYIDQKHWDVVAKQLPHLESLELKLDAKMFVGYDNKNTNFNSLLQINNLKRLILAASSPELVTLDYRLYRDVMTTLELEYLSMKMPLQHQGMFANGEEPLKKPSNLRQLDIVIASDDHNSPTTIISSCFLNFDNLLQLTLQLPDITLNEESLRIICSNCKNIEIFELKRTNIECCEFTIPNKLKEILIIECKGFTCDNLKQILSGRKVEKFSSVKTVYSGQLLDLHVSNSLQYLKCDAVNTRCLISGTKIMENMTQLSWYDGFNDIVDIEGILACPNLETLHIECDPIPLKALLQLKNLHTLSFHHIFALNWSYVEDLLKHLSLHELLISEFHGAEVLDSPVLGFPTTVKILRVNMNMIVQADFWLDLFCQNVELKLIFFGGIGPFHLKRIFNKPHFPQDLRTIEFSGISINCADLRKNFNETIRKTPFLKDFKNENYIVLCR